MQHQPFYSLIYIRRSLADQSLFVNNPFDTPFSFAALSKPASNIRSSSIVLMIDSQIQAHL